jgi:hypothetical protein
LAATAILFGTSSVAGAKSFEHYDTPVLALLAPPPPVVSSDGSDAEGNWSSYTGSAQWFRLSLDGAPWKTGRPIRTTLLPPPAGDAPPPAGSPVPSPDGAAAPEPLPAVSAAAGPETPATSPNARLEFPSAHELRQIRVSLDHASLGEVGHAEPGLPRPLRLFLDSEAPRTAGPRPFRSVLD